MAPQSEDTVRSTSFSSSSTPFWLVQAFSLPSFACSSISSSERESEQAHHLSHFSLYHPSSHPPFIKTHLHIPIPSILIPIPPSSFQYLQFSFQYHHPHSNTTILIPTPSILIPIPPSSFQYHPFSFQYHHLHFTNSAAEGGATGAVRPGPPV